MLALTVVINTEVSACRQFSAPGFAEAWDALYLQCPWATRFQSLEFVTTWYETYRERFSPVLVSKSNLDGMLIGALPLAVSRDKGRLVVAGARQAEYHAWISLPTDRGAFITQALILLREKFHRQPLLFKYIPPETPLDFLTQNSTLKRYCKVRRLRRPLLILNENELTDSFRKKGNKSRINRLKALGKIAFERVTTASEAEPLMADIATQCDLRQGAAHNSLPFREDPLKKLFYTNLLDKPNLLHFTVLKVGNSVLSSHLGLIEKQNRSVSVGLFTHSVAHARHSPGKLHILMLGMLLLQDGISVLDLTPPGGDWKERFASTHDEVSTLTMYGDRRQLWYLRIRTGASASVRKVLEVLRVPLSTFITKIEKARRFVGFGLVGNVRRFWLHLQPVRVYRYEFASIQLGGDTVMSRDRLGDLLAFDPKQTWLTDRQEFLASACERMEKGHHCYTFVDDCGSLVYCSWLVERGKEALLSDLSTRFTIPKDSALLVDCNISSRSREIGLFNSYVKQMLHDARLVSGTRYAYLCVLANDAPAVRAVEMLGFVYQGCA
jgi:CelD/BcsL family acetyltransferase involved in cellulose biosynthesis